MVLYDTGALGTHHLLGVALALADGRQDSVFCRVGIASATVDKDTLHKLPNLSFDLFVRHWLVEERHELFVGTLEAAKQFVPYEFGGNSLVRNIWSRVGLRHGTTL